MLKLPFKFPDFVKYPLHAVTYLLCIYFAYKEFTRGDECRDLRQTIEIQTARIDMLETTVANKDKEISDLVRNLLVKNGIIDRLTYTKTDTLSKGG